MDTSVQEALKIGLVNDQIHSIVISGGTGVGKSFIVRQCLDTWDIPYRVIPVYIDSSQLQESVDFEASLEQGKMVMSSSLLDDDNMRCWLIDDGHVLSPEVRHALLTEAKLRHILLIMTINHEDRVLTDVEWELVDVHVSMEPASLESRVAVLQQTRDVISCADTVLPSTEEHSSKDVVSLIDHKRISSIAVPDAMISLAISYALQARTVGHGAEFVLLQVMKSLALLDGVSYCKPIHAERAALYVLPHRMKRDDTTTSQPSQGENENSKPDRNQLENRAEHASDQADEDTQYEADQNDSMGNEASPNDLNANDGDTHSVMNSAEDTSSQQDDSSEADGSNQSNDSDATQKKSCDSDAMNVGGDDSQRLSSLCLPDTVARIANQLFQWKLESSKTVDRQYRKGSGRRLMTKTKDARGRMIRAYQDEHALEDLALVDTLRAAAPYQRLRAATKTEQGKLSTQSQQLKHQGGKRLSIVIKPQDYRRKAREKRIGAYQLFVVDASGSMAARH
ncbi:MAG: VWA domain-containing protein, partial [Veillonella sp.]|nr:VWA domain-containing protein [Veillonella sp.]